MRSQWRWRRTTRNKLVIAQGNSNHGSFLLSHRRCLISAAINLRSIFFSCRSFLRSRNKSFATHPYEPRRQFERHAFQRPLVPGFLLLTTCWYCYIILSIYSIVVEERRGLVAVVDDEMIRLSLFWRERGLFDIGGLLCRERGSPSTTNYEWIGFAGSSVGCAYAVLSFVWGYIFSEVRPVASRLPTVRKLVPAGGILKSTPSNNLKYFIPNRYVDRMSESVSQIQSRTFRVHKNRLKKNDFNPGRRPFSGKSLDEA